MNDRTDEPILHRVNGPLATAGALVRTERRERRR
jgi:hypothetical protein